MRFLSAKNPFLDKNNYAAVKTSQTRFTNKICEVQNVVQVLSHFFQVTLFLKVGVALANFSRFTF